MTDSNDPKVVPAWATDLARERPDLFEHPTPAVPQEEPGHEGLPPTDDAARAEEILNRAAAEHPSGFPSDQRPDLVEAWYERGQAVHGPVLKKVRDSQPRADEDGTAGLYYFDVDRSLAFHWDGHPQHLVEVSQGGDHEEARFFFVFEAVATLSTMEMAMGLKPSIRKESGNQLHFTMLLFGRTCERWIESIERGTFGLDEFISD